MAKYSSVRHIKCNPIFTHDIGTTNLKQKDKSYLDALSIGSNNSSILDNVLLAGICHGKVPFIENLSYQIPRNQVDLKLLWKLAFPDATEIHNFVHSNDIVAEEVDTPGAISYRARNKYYLYFPDTEKNVPVSNDFLPGDQYIYRLVGIGKLMFIVQLSNKIKLLGWKSEVSDFLIPILNRDLTDFIIGNDPIINFNTNAGSVPIKDKPCFVIVYNHCIVMANLHVSKDEKDLKLIITNKIDSNHLKIFDAHLYSDEHRIIIPILLSTDGNAYFYNQNLDKLYFKMSSVNRTLFKVHIFKNYCFLFNHDEFWVINMESLRPARLYLGIRPLSIFHINDNIFLLANNSKVYKLTFKNQIKATVSARSIIYPLGIALRLLPLHSKPGYSLVLSQYVFEDKTIPQTKKQKGLHVSIFHNETMKIISTKEICDIDLIEYVLMEPLIVNSSYEITFPCDWFVITYRKPSCGSSWVLLNVEDGRIIQICKEGQLDDVATSIFTDYSDFGRTVQVCITTGGKFHLITLTRKKEKVKVDTKNIISTSTGSWNIGGFFQNGLLQLINPHHGLYYSDSITGDKELVKHALKIRPRIFGNAIIIKTATKVLDPVKQWENTLGIENHGSHDNHASSQFLSGHTTKYMFLQNCIERKDREKILCAMVDSENFVYLWDDVLERLPNNTIVVRPILKFRPKVRIINITPILQNFEKSVFEDKSYGIPLFFLLGESGVVYVLSTLEDTPIIQPFLEGSLNTQNTLLEGNCASVWFEYDELVYVKHSLQLVQ